jgi:hypothetical protein
MNDELGQMWKDIVKIYLSFKVLLWDMTWSGKKNLTSLDGSFYPSTQRQYRRLIYYYIILLHVSVVRPSSGKTC